MNQAKDPRVKEHFSELMNLYQKKAIDRLYRDKYSSIKTYRVSEMKCLIMNKALHLLIKPFY